MYLSKFKWGNSFLELNQDLLEKYCECKTSAEIVNIQNKYLMEQAELKLKEKGRLNVVLGEVEIIND